MAAAPAAIHVGMVDSGVGERTGTRGDKLSGMLIDLSTGIANSPEDYKSVGEQLSYLKSIGARVRVLGVGNPFSKKNNGMNEKLDQMVKSNGFYFYGGYKGEKEVVELWQIAPKYDQQNLRENYLTGKIFRIGDIVENLNTGLIGEVMLYLEWYLILCKLFT